MSCVKLLVGSTHNGRRHGHPVKGGFATAQTSITAATRVCLDDHYAAYFLESGHERDEALVEVHFASPPEYAVQELWLPDS